MWPIIFISWVFLASCATTTFSDENSITLNHHINGHDNAVEEAQKHCQKFDKNIKPTTTSCGGVRCISYFDCVARWLTGIHYWGVDFFFLRWGTVERKSIWGS